jgi:hypothetical protein
MNKLTTKRDFRLLLINNRLLRKVPVLNQLAIMLDEEQFKRSRSYSLNDPEEMILRKFRGGK